MTDTAHEKRIKKIEAETAEIKRQIMQLEFQHKKDYMTAQREAEARKKESDMRTNKIDRQIQHISRIMGITYDELENVDLKLQEVGRLLSRPRKPSSLV